MLGFAENFSGWKASGHTSVSLADENDPTPEVLHLKGVIYDTVLEVSQIMNFDSRDTDSDYSAADEKSQESVSAAGGNTENIQIIADAGTLELLTPVDIAMDIEFGAQANDTHLFLEMYNKICDNTYAQDHKELLARTLTAGTYCDEYLEDLDVVRRDKYLPAFERVMHRLAQLECDGTEGKFAHDDDSKRYEDDAYIHCRQRRMFWTIEGSLGLGPQCMRVNDIVVILYGGDLPYVLRPRGDKYLFMGPAYINNIMHGEVIDDLRAGKRQEQTFCLI